MYQKNVVFIFFISVLLYNSTDAMKCSREFKVAMKRSREFEVVMSLNIKFDDFFEEKSVMAIVDLSEDDLRRLEPQQKKCKLAPETEPKPKTEPIFPSRNHRVDLRCSKPECRYTATKNEQITKHLEFHQLQEDDPDKDIRQCDTCDFLCETDSGLTRHNRSHSSLKPYVCELCSRQLKYKDSLKRHMKRIHGRLILAMADDSNLGAQWQ